jgi:hypothetical protein
MSAMGTITLTFARAGMELSWRYGWALYLIQLSGGRPPPLFGSVCVFMISAALTQFMAGKSWRRYQRVLLRCVFLSLSALMVLHQVLYQTFPLLSLDWIRHLLLDPKPLSHWLTLMLTLACVYLIWHGGQLLVTGPRRYYPLCMRFDKGMGLFFLLLITIAFIESRPGFHLAGREFLFLAIAYLMFSLTAMSIARNESSVETSFLSGHRGIGIILSVSILITLLATGIILFFYPYYSGLSDSLSTLTKDAAGTMDTVLFGTLLFIFRTKEQTRQAAETTADSQSLPLNDNTPTATDLDSVPLEGGGGLFQSIVGWSIFSIIGLVLLGALAFFLIHVIRLLLRRSSGDVGEPLPTGWVGDFFRTLLALILLLRDSMVSLLRRVDSAVLVFAQLLNWGRSSGIVMRQNETPSEYGIRLTEVFPNLRVEIQQIVEGFNREVYGQSAAGKESLSHLQSALRRMKGLRHWPMRMKVWFFQ